MRITYGDILRGTYYDVKEEMYAMSNPDCRRSSGRDRRQRRRDCAAVGADAPEITTRFADPGGKRIGLCQKAA